MADNSSNTDNQNTDSSDADKGAEDQTDNTTILGAEGDDKSDKGNGVDKDADKAAAEAATEKSGENKKTPTKTKFDGTRQTAGDDTGPESVKKFFETGLTAV